MKTRKFKTEKIKENTIMKLRYSEVWRRMRLYLLVLVVSGLFSSIAQGKGGAADYAHINVRYHVVDENAKNVREAPVYYKLMIDGKSPDSVGWAPMSNIGMSGNPPTTAKHGGNPNFVGEAGKYFNDWPEHKDHKMELWVKITKSGYRPIVMKYVRNLRSATHSVISDTIVMTKRNSSQAGSSSTRGQESMLLPGAWLERYRGPRGPEWHEWEFQGGSVNGKNSSGTSWSALYTINGNIIQIRDHRLRMSNGRKMASPGYDWHIVSIDTQELKYYRADPGKSPKRTGSPKVLLRR